MKKLLALLLSASLALSICLFAGCGDTPEETTASQTTAASTAETTVASTEQTTEATTAPKDTEAQTTAGESTPAETTTETTSATADTQPEDTTSAAEDTDTPPSTVDLSGYDGYTKLPGYEDVDFGGKTFIISGGIQTPDVMNTDVEIYSDETDLIHTAVRERNLLVEKLYNCKIELYAVGNPQTIASADVTGNMHTLDLYTNTYHSSGYHTGGQNYNLYSLGINFDNPWWDQAFVDTYTLDVNGKDTIYGVVGDFAITAWSSIYTLFYNIDLYQSNEYCQKIDIYQLVRDKKWTMDVFTEMIKNVKHDVNGNSVYAYADEDIMGWVRTGHASHAMHVASNMKIISNVNGSFVFSPAAQANEWSTVIDKGIEMWALEGTETISYSKIPAYIAADKALFASEILGTAIGMKDMDVSLGLVPYPLYSETQDAYCNYVDSHVGLYYIPISVPDPEVIATFFELYACHSSYTVRPAFIESYKVEYLGDEESGEMLDLIFDNLNYDPGYLWWSKYETDVGNMISGAKNTITQWAGRKGSTVVKDIEAAMEGLRDNLY